MTRHEARALIAADFPAQGADMTETFESINAWQHETFGEPSVEAAFKRAAEEWNELRLAWYGGELEPVVAEEAADVVIRLLHMPGVTEAIQRKMAVNRSRTWRMNGDGTGQHVDD